jgi:hypothetical protein
MLQTYFVHGDPKHPSRVGRDIPPKQTATIWVTQASLSGAPVRGLALAKAGTPDRLPQPSWADRERQEKMSETSMTVTGGDARQAMIRVWMAISAVWVTFWLGLALVALSAGVANSFNQRFSLFALIVMIPPLILLVLGAGGRLAFEFLFRGRTIS